MTAPSLCACPGAWVGSELCAGRLSRCTQRANRRGISHQAPSAGGHQLYGQPHIGAAVQQGMGSMPPCRVCGAATSGRLVGGVFNGPSSTIDEALPPSRPAWSAWMPSDRHRIKHGHVAHPGSNPTVEQRREGLATPPPAVTPGGSLRPALCRAVARRCRQLRECCAESR